MNANSLWKMFQHGTYHLEELDVVAQRLDTDLKEGLTTAKIERIRSQPGFKDNSLTSPKATPNYIRFLKHQTGLDPSMLWVTSILCFLAWGTDNGAKLYLHLGIIFAAVNFISCSYSYYKDVSAQAMNSYEPYASFVRFGMELIKVMRNGRLSEIPSNDLVPGDVIFLDGYGKVPADIRVVQTNSCQVDNSCFTGDYTEQARNQDVVVANTEEEEDVFNATNILFSGASYTGKVSGVVIFTGDNTIKGKIAALIRDGAAIPAITPKMEIERFLHITSYLALFLGAAVLIVGLSRGATPLVFVCVIGVMFANIPLSLQVTVRFLFGRAPHSLLADKGVLVKESEVLPTLGGINVLVTPKHGILTTNQLTLTTLFYNNSKVAIEGPARYPDDPTFNAFSHILALRNKSEFVESEENLSKDARDRDCWYGDPFEKSMLRFVGQVLEKNRTTVKEIRRDCRTIAEVRFKNDYDMSVHYMGEGRPLKLLCKGDPEVIYSLCKSTMVDGQARDTTPEDTRLYLAARRALTSQGLNVLAFAECDLGPMYTKDFEFNTDPPYNFPTPAGLTKELVFVGLAGFKDPFRPAVHKAIQTAKDASIQVIMATYDPPDLAELVARELKLITLPTRQSIALQDGIPFEEIHRVDPNDPRIGAIVISGTELTEMKDQEELVNKLNYNEIVFADINPSQKVQIVKALQAKKTVGRVDKEVKQKPALTATLIDVQDKSSETESKQQQQLPRVSVAIVGEGVNDCPAIKEADIGISTMCGSDIAKDSADMILLDDSLVAIVASIEHGRLVMDNLKKSIAYTLSSNLPQMAPFLVWMLLDVPLPLSTVLILWINFGTDRSPP